MKKLICIFLIVILTITVTACSNNKDVNGKNEITDKPTDEITNKPIDIDLSVDENEPKYVKCYLIDQLYRNPGEERKYLAQEIFKLNLKHYTFLEGDQLDDNTCNLDAGGVDSSLASGTKQVGDRTYIYDSTYEDREWNEHFTLTINYSLKAGSVSPRGTLLEYTKGLLYYTGIVEDIGKEPQIHGDENSFWYIYNKEDEDSSTESILDIYILLKEPEKIALGYSVYSYLGFSIKMQYWDEIGKAKLNYIMNDVKQMLKENHNFDLSDFNINMLNNN